jgi:hypothetical protein
VSPNGKSALSRIVEAARCLFWLNGYGMTTVTKSSNAPKLIPAASTISSAPKKTFSSPFSATTLASSCP